MDVKIACFEPVRVSLSQRGTTEATQQCAPPKLPRPTLLYVSRASLFNKIHRHLRPRPSPDQLFPLLSHSFDPTTPSTQHCRLLLSQASQLPIRISYTYLHTCISYSSHSSPLLQNLEPEKSEKIQKFKSSFLNITHLSYPSLSHLSTLNTRFIVHRCFELNFLIPHVPSLAAPTRATHSASRPNNAPNGQHQQLQINNAILTFLPVTPVEPHCPQRRR